LSQHLHTNCSHLTADYPYWSALDIQDKGPIGTVKYKTGIVRVT
jgi:hypothetical protein